MNIILLTLLSICFIFYLFLGIYSYRIDKKSKVNLTFFALCISTCVWATGYAFMLISSRVETANLWRIFASLGWCFFVGLWLAFSVTLKNSNQKGTSLKIKALIYIPSSLFFISNIISDPSKVMVRQSYGFVDIYVTSPVGMIFNIYFPIFFIAGLILILSRGRNSKKNRVKKQTKTILITGLVSFIIGTVTDIILPITGINVFPSAIIAASIAMAGIYYAINKHRMMSISPEFVSEYIYKAVNEPIFILDEGFCIKSCNEAALMVTGYNFKEIEHNTLVTLVNCRNYNFNTIMEVGYVSNIEVNLKRRGRADLVCELTGTVISDEYKDILGIVILLHDITERKHIDEIQKKYATKLEESNLTLKNEIRDRLHAENQIRHFVYYDALTELPNRKKMLEEFNTLLAFKNEKFAVFFIDLDDFKNINDNFGHQTGDDVLKGIAERLKSILRSNDTICRIGGDEFIILLRDLKSTLNAEKIAVAISKVLEPAFTYNENDLYVGASIGISIFPEHGTDADTLIRNADLAMYEVKNNGGYGYNIYCSELNTKVIDKLSMKIKLNNAMTNHEFIAYYQPVIDIKSMKIISAEALIRWDSKGGIIPPSEFIPTAKNVGEIIAIDNWMLGNACIQCKKWHDQGWSDITISVNTSYKQLSQGNFFDLVKDILQSHSLDPRYIILEITEDEAMENPELIINLLTQLKTIGIKISLDDFGKGYSSLNYVNRLPIDILKIDRSLIMNLKEGAKNIPIIKSIIVMAHSLDIRVVAEGIETEDQFKILKKLQCDYIQGYLISKPLAVDDFEKDFFPNLS